jgi:hypothetical protein
MCAKPQMISYSASSFTVAILLKKIAGRAAMSADMGWPHTRN